MKTRIIQDEPEPTEDRPRTEPSAAERRDASRLRRLVAALGARLGLRSSHVSKGEA